MKSKWLVRGFDSFSKYCSTVSGIVGAATIFGMTLIVTIDVLARHFLGKSILVAVEISGYCLVALIFLGLAYTEMKGKHIIIMFFIGRLSQRKQKLVGVINTIVAAIFLGWLTWLTCRPVIQNYVTGYTSITGTHTPMWIPTLMIPVGLSILVIQLMAKAINELRS